MDKPYPAQLGYRMPPEWSPHAATMLAWPHNGETWPRNLHEAQSEFVQLVHAIANDEAVLLLAHQDFHDAIWHRLHQRNNTRQPVTLLDIPTNDAWVRDYGPTLVSDGKSLVAVDWKYNAWGGKYPPFDDDQQVVRRWVQRHPAYQRFESSLCIEGGAIEMDQDPVVMCTRSCALNPNRNSVTQDGVQAELERCLGAEKVVWLAGNGIAGDDTDGHIDQLARFVPGGRILCAAAEKSDDQFEALEQHRIDLTAELQRLGLAYELIELPMPDPLFAFGTRLPASYCNFYITNHSVLVPTFGKAQDELAIGIVADCFADRKVIGLPSMHLSVGLGSFHCMTQQIPAVSASVAGTCPPEPRW